ncbi:recombinase family protein [Halovulum sp. GXIMD14794]
MRCAIYARYSSDLQSAASIEDQVRMCRERAARDGWEIVEVFADHGLSGASLLRPGIQAMLSQARAGHFDLVLAEALDRLSRDQADIATIHKQLRFAGIPLVTLSEGEISELHIGLKGTMNQLFLKDLADKTRRGLRGRVEAGKSGGGNCYGYDVVRTWSPEGNARRGERTINVEQAEIVRRIFRDYAHGASPRAIAKALNAEAIAGPTGTAWGPSTIHGNKDRGTGILNNELYIGRLVWNRLRYIKDPETGKRVSRLNPPEALVITDVPELRIIDDATWGAVKARQSEAALGKRASPESDGFWEKRRPQYLLSGLIKCGCCGAGFVKISKHHFGCAGARNKGTCSVTRTIRKDALEAHILDGLQHALMRDELLEAFCTEYTRELNTLRRAQNDTRDRDRARLDKIDRDLERLLDAIVEGAPAARVKDRMTPSCTGLARMPPGSFPNVMPLPCMKSRLISRPERSRSGVAASDAILGMTAKSPCSQNRPSSRSDWLCDVSSKPATRSCVTPPASRALLFRIIS